MVSRCASVACVRSWMLIHAVPLVLFRYSFLGYTEDHLEEGAFVLFREDGGWTASRFRQELGCPDAFYQESGYGKVARCLGLSFAFTADAFDVGGSPVCFSTERFLSVYPRSRTIVSHGSMVLMGEVESCMSMSVA